MCSRVAMVARMIIATNKPKRSRIVADITESHPFHAVRCLVSACLGACSPSGTQKAPECTDQASRRSMHFHADIVTCFSLTVQEKLKRNKVLERVEKKRSS